MAVELATGYINLVPSATGIGAAIAKELGAPLAKAAQDAGTDASKKLGAGLLGGASDIGKKLLIATGLATLGGIAIRSAMQVEDANNLIARSTGATGKALDGLQQSFRNVASGSASSFEVISTTLAELSQRTGLTGKALESLTSEVTSFNRITKDAPVTVASLTSALAGFNVPANEMGKVLDHLFIISQKTGVPLADLLSTLQTAGPVARQFGFSVEFTAGFLAQLNKVGVDSNAVVAGLRKAFVGFAQDGREPAAALRETLGSMQDLLAAGKTAEARQLAVQLFGPRGTGLIDAALSGKVSLATLGDQIDVTGAGILETAKKTSTLAGAMGILRNNLKLAFAEFATPAIEAANSALRSVLPTIRDIGAEFAKLPDAVKISAVGLVGIASLAGPLGNLGQGIDGLARLASGLGTGFQLAAVRGLELLDSLKAVGAAQALAGLAAGGLLVGVGALIVAFEASDGPYERITANANKFATAQIRAALASGDQRAALAALKTDLISIDRNIAALTAREKQLDEERNSGKRSIAETNQLYGETASLLLDQQTRHDGLAAKIRELNAARKEQEATDKATTTSLATYASAVAHGAETTDAFTVLTDDAKKAVLDFQGALLTTAGGTIGYQQSLLNISQAEQDLADARKDHPDDLELIHEKELALQQARLQGVAAADAESKSFQQLVDALDAGTISYDAELARIQEQIRLHPENAAGYQLEIDKLNDAKFTVDNMPKTASTKYTIDISEAIASLNTVNSAVNETFAKSGVSFRFPTFAAPPTAAGGIFTTPQLRMFAEAGPEAVLPLNDPERAWELIGKSGLVASTSASPASDVRGGLFDGANVTIGDRNVIPDLDYYSRTRAAGV